MLLTVLQHGAHVDAADFTGQTALHWTAVRGSFQVAELLLEHGARVELADSHGYRVCIDYAHAVNVADLVYA